MGIRCSQGFNGGIPRLEVFGVAEHLGVVLTVVLGNDVYVVFHVDCGVVLLEISSEEGDVGDGKVDVALVACVVSKGSEERAGRRLEVACTVEGVLLEVAGVKEELKLFKLFTKGLYGVVDVGVEFSQACDVRACVVDEYVDAVVGFVEHGKGMVGVGELVAKVLDAQHAGLVGVVSVVDHLLDGVALLEMDMSLGKVSCAPTGHGSLCLESLVLEKSCGVEITRAGNASAQAHHDVLGKVSGELSRAIDGVESAHPARERVVVLGLALDKGRELIVAESRDGEDVVYSIEDGCMCACESIALCVHLFLCSPEDGSSELGHDELDEEHALHGASEKVHALVLGECMGVAVLELDLCDDVTVSLERLDANGANELVVMGLAGVSEVLLDLEIEKESDVGRDGVESNTGTSASTSAEASVVVPGVLEEDGTDGSLDVELGGAMVGNDVSLCLGDGGLDFGVTLLDGEGGEFRVAKSDVTKLLEESSVAVLVKLVGVGLDLATLLVLVLALVGVDGGGDEKSEMLVGGCGEQDLDDVVACFDDVYRWLAEVVLALLERDDEACDAFDLKAGSINTVTSFLDVMGNARGGDDDGNRLALGLKDEALDRGDGDGSVLDEEMEGGVGGVSNRDLLEHLELVNARSVIECVGEAVIHGLELCG